LSKSAWGRLLGISPPTVSNYSTGKYAIPETIALRARHFRDVHERCRQLRAQMHDLLVQMRDMQDQLGDVRAQVRHLERVIDSKEWLYSEKGEAPWRDQYQPQPSA
jgi:predicted transcriptional regulator